MNDTTETLSVDTADMPPDPTLTAAPTAMKNARETPEEAGPGVIETKNMDVFYGDFKAVADVSMNFAFNEISALIGPSGCGKSTVLRSLNRMNDLIPTARTDGEVLYHGANIYAPCFDPV